VWGSMKLIFLIFLISFLTWCNGKSAELEFRNLKTSYKTTQKIKFEIKNNTIVNIAFSCPVQKFSDGKWFEVLQDVETYNNQSLLPVREVKSKNLLKVNWKMDNLKRALRIFEMPISGKYRFALRYSKPGKKLTIDSMPVIYSSDFEINLAK
jgi:hypothetical protein